MPSMLIRSAKILVGEELTTANIFIEDRVIKKIFKTRPSASADSNIDASGLIALPGMIDAHVHLRDLEASYKETFETGSRAAAAGGFTTVFDMPNSRPPTDSSSKLAEKMAKAEGRLFSNVAFQAALVSNEEELRRMAGQGAIAFKLYLNKTVETFDSSSETELANAFHAAKESDAIVTVHAEDGDAIRRFQQESIARGRTTIRDFLKAHSPRTEVSAVKSILRMGSELGVRTHICHITLPESVRMVRRTRNASCEATAHHLLLNESIFRKQKTLAICVPPIRNEATRSRLWSLFAKGQVDILASDHAPHTLEEKTSEDAWKAASGVPGLETSLPLLFTELSRGKISLRRIVESTAALPAKLFRLHRKGAIREGLDADITLVDPKAKFRIEPENFETKAKFSPFKGRRCVGIAAYTIVNGEVVAERGRIVGPAAGKVTKSETAWASS